MSLDCIRLRGHLERLVERDSELLVGDDAAELALGGLRRLLRDDAHRAREAVAGAERGREDVEVLRELLAELVPDAARLAPHVQVQADRGRPVRRTTQIGPRATPAMTARSSPPITESPDHPARIVLDLGDVDVVREPVDIHEIERFFCFCWLTAASSASTSFRRSRACSSAGSVTNSPSRATRARFERRLQSERMREDGQREDQDDDQRDQQPRLEELVAERRLVRRRGSGRRALVGEGHRLVALDGDRDVDVLIRLRGRPIAQQVLVRELEAERVVDLRRAPRATTQRRRFRRCRRRSSGGRPALKSGDSMPTV